MGRKSRSSRTWRSLMITPLISPLAASKTSPPVAPPPTVATAKKHAQKRKAKQPDWVGETLWVGAFGDPAPPPEQPSTQRGFEQPLATLPASSSSDTQLSPPPPPLPPASSQPIGSPGSPQPPRKRARGRGKALVQQARPVFAVIQPGIEIVEDEHLTPGQPGHYRRLKVQCPHEHHHLPGQPCTRTRNTGAAQTVHFGEMEPAGYLAAWVRGGRELASKEAHMDRSYQPTLSEVEAAMRTEGWLPCDPAPAQVGRS